MAPRSNTTPKHFISNCPQIHHQQLPCRHRNFSSGTPHICQFVEMPDRDSMLIKCMIRKFGSLILVINVICMSSYWEHSCAYTLGELLIRKKLVEPWQTTNWTKNFLHRPRQTLVAHFISSSAVLSCICETETQHLNFSMAHHFYLKVHSCNFDPKPVYPWYTKWGSHQGKLGYPVLSKTWASFHYP